MPKNKVRPPKPKEPAAKDQPPTLEAKGKAGRPVGAKTRATTFSDLAKAHVNTKKFFDAVAGRADEGCLKSMELIMYYGLGKPKDGVPGRFDVNDNPDAVRRRIKLLQDKIRARDKRLPAGALKVLEPDGIGAEPPDAGEAN